MSYLSPKSAADACALAADLNPRIIAGCTDFYPSRQPGGDRRALLDLTQVPEFHGITQSDAGWRIGALTTWTEIAQADLPSAFHGLQRAAKEVGSIQIQNRATIGGNICNASPAADGVPPLLTLGAMVEIRSISGQRQVALADFITGVRQVDLAPGEIVSAVVVPSVAPDMHADFLKLGSRTHLVISIAMVACVVRLQWDKIVKARVAVGSCSPVATRLPDLERRLAGKTVSEVGEMRISGTDLRQLSPISDVRGSADYRCDVVGELCRRVVLSASQRS